MIEQFFQDLLTPANILGAIATPFAMAGAWMAAHRTANTRLWFPIFLAGSVFMLLSMIAARTWSLVFLEAYFVYTNVVGTWKAYRPPPVEAEPPSHVVSIPIEEETPEPEPQAVKDVLLYPWQLDRVEFAGARLTLKDPLPTGVKPGTRLTLKGGRMLPAEEGDAVHGIAL